MSRFSRFPDFWEIGPYSSGDNFSESCAPRKMMQNGIDEIFWGPNFQKHILFHFKNLWVLATRILVPRSWYQDLGTKILVPGSWYQNPGTRIPGSWTKIFVLANSH